MACTKPHRRKALAPATGILALWLLAGYCQADGEISPDLIVSAHRGGAAYAPENTMTAFRNAVRLGVDDLEADTLLTADGELVLIHDDTLDRTTNCQGFVSDWAADDLRNCDAAHWFTPGEPTTNGQENGNHPLRGAGIQIPLASDLLDYLLSLYRAGQRVPTATIEIKVVPDRRDEEGARRTDPSSYPTASALVALINESRYALIRDRVVVQSFWPPALDLVKRLDPNIRTLFLTTPDVGALASENLAYAVAGGHEITAPQSKSPDFGSEYVTAAHLARKRVIPWTVDSSDEIRRVAATGSDGMITNFPACMLILQGRLSEDVQRTPVDVPADTRKNGKKKDGKEHIRIGNTAACP